MSYPCDPDSPDRDLRPQSAAWTVSIGQEWWARVAPSQDLTGRDVTAVLWTSWTDRNPPASGEEVQVRRSDDDTQVWVGQPAGVAKAGGVFYIALAPTAGDPPTTYAAVTLYVESRGGRA